MLVDLDLPYRDVCAAELCLSLSLCTVPASASARFAFPTHELVLCVLGSSHQVRVQGAFNLCETVACLGMGQSLPARREETGYRFTSSVERLQPASFETLVARLVDRAEVDERTMLGRFPGHLQALTMIWVGADGRRWATWHTYPQDGEVVRTRSWLR
jgi:hypothetical protein